MLIIVSCECGQQFRTDEFNAGREARCMFCSRTLTVPAAPSAPTEGTIARPELGKSPYSGRAIASFALGLL